MSYDLMVFDPTVAPKERKDFMKWYAQLHIPAYREQPFRRNVNTNSGLT
ncbi:hypothetical protein [Psychromonas sp. MME2]